MTNMAERQSELDEQTTDELIHLVRKFRWMGLEEEATKVQARLACRILLSASDRSRQLRMNGQKDGGQNVLSINGIRRVQGNATGCAARGRDK